MINLRARKKYFFYSIIRWITTAICSLPVIVYGLVCFVTSLINKGAEIVMSQMLSIYLSIPAVAVNIFFIIFGSFYVKKLRRETTFELYEIVTSTKLPNKLPKVVYVYTCHGDMMQARVLQNSLQTYKNMEVWVSEGSENPEIIESSRKFAQQHGFKFYYVGGKGSSNKAENLNAFMKNACPDYDYLLITDADEALDKNFVDYAVRCFHAPKIKNLGYVSALNYCYEGDSLFRNVCCNCDNSTFYTKDFTRVFTTGYKSNLYSASCLISNKLLEKNNGLFPDGCLEDVFLESISLRNGFTSIILPISPAGQLFDKNIYKYIERYMRINDWGACLFHQEHLNKYNEKYSVWFSTFLTKCIQPIIWFFGLVILILFGWLIWTSSDALFKNAMFIFTITSALGTAILYVIFNNIVDCTWKTSCNRFAPLWFIIKPMFIIAKLPDEIIHWFKSYFLKKYSFFGGSNQKSNSKHPNRKKVLISVLWLLITGMMIVSLCLAFVLKIGFANKYYNLGFLFGIVILSLFFLSFLAKILLYSMSLIKAKYDPDKFIKPREFYEFKKDKEKMRA